MNKPSPSMLMITSVNVTIDANSAGHYGHMPYRRISGSFVADELPPGGIGGPMFVFNSQDIKPYISYVLDNLPYILTSPDHDSREIAQLLLKWKCDELS